ncbi:sulfurtransferase [Geothrix limicola]|uniref:Sulfurtransferase n=1 Tax=Geothrix limicola TaxID=2927978 RepID=A0ABQ5QHU7_9BACT|nr:rhodanese-like domain-containing protein [Geothrix limicola]GLH74262.1 sulfurtransferase [Geothrix limicola]
MIAAIHTPTTLEGWMKAYPFLPGALFAALCLVILLLVALPRLASWKRAKGRPVLDPLQVDELLLGSGALVVDLRSAEAFKTGHIRGCLHVPFEELAARFPTPDPKARRAMILVDETDQISHQAYDQLVARGFHWIYVMKGGMGAWRRASRPMAK